MAAIISLFIFPFLIILTEIWWSNVISGKPKGMKAWAVKGYDNLALNATRLLHLGSHILNLLVETKFALLTKFQILPMMQGYNYTIGVTVCCMCRMQDLVFDCLCPDHCFLHLLLSVIFLVAVSGLGVMIIVIIVCVLFVVLIVTCVCCCCCCSNKRSKR